MPAFASVCANESELYCGLVRERGMVRTSTTRLMPTPPTRLMNSSTGRVECPMVKKGWDIGSAPERDRARSHGALVQARHVTLTWASIFKCARPRFRCAELWSKRLLGGQREWSERRGRAHRVPGAERLIEQHFGKPLADGRRMLEPVSGAGRGKEHIRLVRMPVDDEPRVVLPRVEAGPGIETARTDVREIRCDVGRMHPGDLPGGRRLLFLVGIGDPARLLVRNLEAPFLPGIKRKAVDMGRRPVRLAHVPDEDRA